MPPKMPREAVDDHQRLTDHRIYEGRRHMPKSDDICRKRIPSPLRVRAPQVRVCQFPPRTQTPNLLVRSSSKTHFKLMPLAEKGNFLNLNLAVTAACASEIPMQYAEPPHLKDRIWETDLLIGVLVVNVSSEHSQAIVLQ
jgi:hypothetical protein